MQEGRGGRRREPIVMSKEDERAKKFAEEKLAKLRELENGTREPENVEDMSDLVEDGENSREKGMAEPITQWPSKIGLGKMIESIHSINV